MIAAGNGWSDVVAVLLEAGASVDASPDSGETALAQAAMSGHLEIVESLLAAGATVDAATKDGWTPLMLAADEFGDVVRRLLLAGADVAAASDKGETALHAAASATDQSIVRALLEHGANPNAVGLVATEGVERNATALSIATSWCHLEAIRALIAAAADVPAAGRHDRL